VIGELPAADPIFPPDLFARMPIASAIAGSFLSAALLFAIDTYGPLYAQGVPGGQAAQAGAVITPLFLSWALSVAIAAKVVIRFGFRTTCVVGMGMVALGMAGLSYGASRPESAVGWFQVSLIMTGLGFGPASLSCILGVQNAVDWNRRGAATGAVTFSRVLGGALGVGLLGATLGFEFGHRLASAKAGAIDIVAALRPETHALLTVEQLPVVPEALGRTLRDVFLQLFAPAVLAILCGSRLAPGRAVSRPEPNREPADNLILSTMEP